MSELEKALYISHHNRITAELACIDRAETYKMINVEGEYSPAQIIRMGELTIQLLEIEQSPLYSIISSRIGSFIDSLLTHEDRITREALLHYIAIIDSALSHRSTVSGVIPPENRRCSRPMVEGTELDDEPFQYLDDFPAWPTVRVVDCSDVRCRDPRIITPTTARCREELYGRLYM